MRVQSYLTFNGNCEQALKFYGNLFDAEIVNKQKYKDAKIDIPSSYVNKLQHAELKGKNIHIMAYDAAPDTPINSGNKIQLSVDTRNESEAEKIFNHLSKEGKIHDEFVEREWGFYGRCTDQFGTSWMVNVSK